MDFPTLGLDDNGIYLTAKLEANLDDYLGHSVVVIKKPEVYKGTLIAHRFTLPKVADSMSVASIQPAVNFDIVRTNAYAWFIASGPPTQGTNSLGGEIWYRRLQWTGTNASLDSTWTAIPEPNPTYRDYYDLGIPLVFAPQATNLGGSGISLYPIGSLITTAVVRNGSLWICQAVGLSGTNGSYLGGGSPSSVDRSGVQWIKLKADLETGLLSYRNHGRIWDASTSDPYWFYYPSMMVNCAGDLLAGFSGSKTSSYINAFYTWWRPEAHIQVIPRVLRTGDAEMPGYEWGDYSATTLDPSDEMTFWTVQEYTEAAEDVALPWQTVISKIKLSP